MADTEVRVPDIGDFKDVPIIEVHVREGQPINAEDPIVTLESDKATMDVPSPASGTIEKLLVKIGDKVSEGVVIMQFESAGAEQASARPSVSAPPAPVSAPSGVADVRIPDIGDFKDVPVIEIFVKVGDSVLEMGEAHGKYETMPAMFYLYVPNMEAVYRQALAAGATSFQEPTDQPYGDRNAGVKDAFGNTWYIATHIKDVKM